MAAAAALRPALSQGTPMDTHTRFITIRGQQITLPVYFSDDSDPSYFD